MRHEDDGFLSIEEESPSPHCEDCEKLAQLESDDSALCLPCWEARHELEWLLARSTERRMTWSLT